jgi:hypothetical protein
MAKLFVEDSNAYPPYSPRIHDVLMDDGSVVPTKFEHGQKVEMDEAIAAKFLKDPAFIVTNADGKRIKPLTQNDGTAVLDEEEVVATYDELSLDALVVRANATMGGEKITRSKGKAKVIEFLKEVRGVEEAKAKTAAERPEGAPAVGGDPAAAGDMKPGEVDNFFGDED